MIGFHRNCKFSMDFDSNLATVWLVTKNSAALSVWQVGVAIIPALWTSSLLSDYARPAVLKQHV